MSAVRWCDIDGKKCMRIFPEGMEGSGISQTTSFIWDDVRQREIPVQRNVDACPNCNPAVPARRRAIQPATVVPDTE